MAKKAGRDRDGAARSARAGMRVLRKWAGFKSRHAMTEEAKRREGRGAKAVKLNGETWKAVEEGKTDLKYWHLESLQDVSGVPTGILLVSTHVMSLLRDGDGETARAFARGLRAIASDVEAVVPRTAKGLNYLQQKKTLERFFAVWRASGCDVARKKRRDVC